MEYHFKTDAIDRYYHRDPEDANKYIVCSCARGENDYIEEFVSHYLNMGFDKVIICDNNPDDSVEDVLKSYIDAGTVEIFDCRGFDSFQVQFYSMFAHEGNYKWCAFFDIDEFLELGIYTNIKEFLETVEEDCVSFNWIVYGTNGEKHIRPGSVQERFPEPTRPISLFKENVFVKSILRGGYDRFKDCWFNGSHIPMCSNPMKYNIGGYHVVDYQSHTHFPPRYKCGYLKHYYTKSFDEWIKKASRGWPDGTPTLSAANVFIPENEYTIPIDKYTYGFFISPESSDSFVERCKAALDNYDVIEITNSDHQVYALTVQFMCLLKGTTGHTFVFEDDHIDDVLFSVFMEYAMETGNRVVFARNHDEVWRAYLRYHTKGDTYYILDLR